MGRARVNRAGRKPVRAGRSTLRNRPSWNTVEGSTLCNSRYKIQADSGRNDHALEAVVLTTYCLQMACVTNWIPESSHVTFAGPMISQCTSRRNMKRMSFFRTCKRKKKRYLIICLGTLVLPTMYSLSLLTTTCFIISKTYIFH